MYRRFDTPEYINWRNSVFRRDGYQCKFPGCGSKRYLNAHHIQMWAKSPDLRFEKSNGITLCYDCHNMVTGKENEYIEMFNEIVAKIERRPSDPFLIDKLLIEQRKKNGKKGK